MKVILLEELKGRGGEGDVIDVSTGYAVNFLLPRKIAITATKGNLKQLELRKHNIAKRETTRLDSADKLMAALEGQMVRIGAKVGEEGQLFGSVTPAQVAEAVNEKFGTEIDRKRIDLHGVIKTAGEHSATVSIYRELKATVTIEVVDEKLLAAAALEATSAKAEEAAEAAETVDAAEATDSANIESVAETLEGVEAQLENVAATLVEAAEAAAGAAGDEADIAAIADAAVEVLQDVERVVDAAIADADVADVVDAADADVADDVDVADADAADADTTENDIVEESEN